MNLFSKFFQKFYQIFIRFSNLQARSELIPGIVILLQKQWRGYLCRQRYKKMKAALVIMEYYRRYKQRSYIKQLESTFKSAKSLKDYGKSLPWPPENFAIRHVVPSLKKMYARWWAWMVLRVIPKEDWPQLRLKVLFIVKLIPIRYFTSNSSSSDISRVCIAIPATPMGPRATMGGKLSIQTRRECSQRRFQRVYKQS